VQTSTHAAPRQAFIYLRVSTTRQVDEGISLENQEAKCRARAAELGLEVGDVFRDEGISGREGVDGRPGLARLVKAHRTALAAGNAAVVIVYAIERLARRQRLLWHLLDTNDGEGLSLVSVTQNFETVTPMGRAFLGMIGVWAQLEADMASARTTDALAHAKANGVKLGGAAIALDSLPPETVEMIQSLDAKGLSARRIAERLDELKVPTRRGSGGWRHKAVLDVLKFVDPTRGKVDED